MIYILQKYKELGRTEEENDFGPAPHQMSVLSPSFSSVLPLGYTGASIEELNQFENSKNGNRSDDKDGKGEKKRGVEEREEWMMNPGEDRAIAGLSTFNFLLCVLIEYN